MKVHITTAVSSVTTVEGDESHRTSFEKGWEGTVTHTLADRLVAMGVARKVEAHAKAPEKPQDVKKADKA